jgi:hypothetical protein
VPRASTTPSTVVPSASTVPVAPWTKLQDGVHKPKKYMGGTACYAYAASSGEPYDLLEALSSPHWKLAMPHEYGALLHNKIWRLITPQQGRNLIDCKLVYKVKHKAYGSIDHYKS